MITTVKSTSGKVVCAGIPIETRPVTMEETPEVLYFIAMGWLERIKIEPKPEAIPVEADGPAKVVKRPGRIPKARGE